MPKKILIASITLRNDTTPGTFLSRTVSSALREYADAIDGNRAGSRALEIFNCKDGTQISCIVGSLLCEKKDIRSPGLVPRFEP